MILAAGLLAISALLGGCDGWAALLALLLFRWLCLSPDESSPLARAARLLTAAAASALVPCFRRRRSGRADDAETSDKTTGALFDFPGWWRVYNDALDMFPVFTKGLTSAVQWSVHNLLGQIVSNDPVSAKPYFAEFAYGLLYHGPSGHYFYNWLDEAIEGDGFVPVCAKVAVDQLLYYPVGTLVLHAFQRNSYGNEAVAAPKIWADLWADCRDAWKVLPLVQAVNFRFVATRHRVLFSNAVFLAVHVVGAATVVLSRT